MIDYARAEQLLLHIIPRQVVRLHGHTIYRCLSGNEWSIDDSEPVLLLRAIDLLLGPAVREPVTAGEE